MSNSFDQPAGGAANTAPTVADASNPFSVPGAGVNPSPDPTPRLDLAANAKTPEEAEILQPGGPPTPVQPMGLDSPQNRADIDDITSNMKDQLLPRPPSGEGDPGGAPAPQTTTAELGAPGAIATNTGAQQPGPATPAPAQVQSADAGSAAAAAAQPGAAKPEIYGPPAPGETTPGAMAQAGAAKPEIYGPPAPSETTQTALAQASAQTIAERPVEVRNGPELQFEQAPAASGSASVVTPPPVQTSPGPVEVASNTIAAPTAAAATTSTPSATTANTPALAPTTQPEIYGPPLPPQSPATGSETAAAPVPTSPQEQLVADVLKNNPDLGTSASPTAMSNFGGRPRDPLPTIQVATAQTNEAGPPSPPAQVKVRPDTPPPPPSLKLPPETGLSKRPLYSLGAMASNLSPAKRAECIFLAQGYEKDLQNAANIVSFGTPTDQTSIGSSATIQHDSFIINANELAVLFNSRCTGS